MRIKPKKHTRARREPQFPPAPWQEFIEIKPKL